MKDRVLRRDPTYRVWRGMKTRCYNSHCASYAVYGGRGIQVCRRWWKFENFLADMGERPAGKTIDRRNNELGYSKKNCHWATRTEQGRNKRNIRRITLNGKTQCLSAWAEEYRICATTLKSRLDSGWPVKKALTTKTRRSVNGHYVCD